MLYLDFLIQNAILLATSQYGERPSAISGAPQYTIHREISIKEKMGVSHKIHSQMLTMQELTVGEEQEGTNDEMLCGPSCSQPMYCY